MSFTLNNKDDITSWLQKYHINGLIQDDLTVDVLGSVDLSQKEIIEFPFQWGNIHGDFSCWLCELITLKGAPKRIDGKFDFSANNLTNLDYFPEYVGGNMDFFGNFLNEASFKNFYCDFKEQFSHSYQPGEQLPDLNTPIDFLLPYYHQSDDLGNQKTFLFSFNKRELMGILLERKIIQSAWWNSFNDNQASSITKI